MLVPLRNLGRGGVVLETPPQDLPLNQFTNGQNVTFRNGKAAKANGWRSLVDATIEAFWFETWKAVTTEYVIFCGDGALRRWDGTSVTTPTGVTLTPTNIEWSSEKYASFVILNNGADEPFYNTNAIGSTWGNLPGWATPFSTNGCKVVRSFKGFLFALGVGTDPYTIYWSDVGLNGNMPTNWDWTRLVVPTSLAGFNTFSSADGELVDAAVLGDALIVYSDRGAYAGTFLPGSTTYVFAWNRLPIEGGLIGRNAVAAFDNFHFVVGNDSLYIHDGANKREVADSIVERTFYGELSNRSNISITRDDAYHEIIVAYAANGAEFPNRQLRWNWNENTWTFEDTTSGSGATIEYGTVYKQGVRFTPPTTWDALSGLVTWESWFGTSWSSLLAADADSQRVHRLGTTHDDVGSETSVLYETEYGSDRNGDYIAYVERTHLDLDEAKGGTSRRSKVLALYPQIQGTGTVDFQVGWSQSPSLPVAWGEKRTLDLSDPLNYKVSVRGSGRYLAYRAGQWESPSAGKWELSGMDLVVVDDGAR